MSTKTLSLLVPLALACRRACVRATRAATAVGALSCRARRARHERQDPHDERGRHRRRIRAHRRRPLRGGRHEPARRRAAARARSISKAAPPCRGSSTTTTTSCCSACARATTRGSSPPLRSATCSPLLRAKAADAAERRMDHVDRRLRHQPVRAAARRAAFSDARRARLRDAESSRVSYSMSFAGPSVTNTLGKRFFEQAGIEVGADGAIAGGVPDCRTRRRARCTSCASGKRSRIKNAARKTRCAMPRAWGSRRISTKAASRRRARPPTARRTSIATAPTTRCSTLYAEGALTQRIRLNFLHMETDVATPELAARLANVFPRYGDDLLKIVGIGEFTAGASPIIAEASEVWRAGTRRVAEAGWRNENHSLTPGDFKVIIDEWERSTPPCRRPASSRAALGRRARAVHHAGVRRQAQGARRRRQRARRLALHQRHGAAERPAVQAARSTAAFRSA